MPVSSSRRSAPLRVSTRSSRYSAASSAPTAQLPAIEQAVPRSAALRRPSTDWHSIASASLPSRGPPSPATEAPVRCFSSDVTIGILDTAILGRAPLRHDHAARDALAALLELLREVVELDLVRDLVAGRADQGDGERHEREPLHDM